MSMAQLVDHEGKLAISLGWQKNFDKPEENNLLIVAKKLKAGGTYAHILGYFVEFTGNTGVVYAHGRRYVIQTDDEREWERVVLTRPVKMPRRGKRQGCAYSWEWERGRWVRIWL